MRSKSLFLSLFIILLIYNCSSLPDSYQSGKKSYDKKDYAQAVVGLESANDAAPGQEDIEDVLAKAKDQYSKELIVYEKTLNQYDINQRIVKLELANDQLGSSIVLNDKIHKAKVKDGPGMFAGMKKKMNENYRTDAEIYADLLASQRLAKQKLEGQLKLLQDSKSNVTADTDRIVASSKKKPVAALDNYAPFFPYSPFWPELALKEQSVKDSTVDHYENLGFRQLRRNRYAKAIEFLKKGLEIIPDSEKSIGGIQSVEAKKAYNKKDYRNSFELINVALSSYPKSSFAPKFKKKVKRTLFKTEMKKARKLVKSSVIQKNTEAFAIYDYLLSSVVEDDQKLDKKVLKKHKKLKTIIAKRLIAKAKRLHKKSSFKYANTELKYYQLAHVFDPVLATKYQKKARFTMAVSNEKKRYNVLIYDQKYKNKVDYTDTNLTLSESLARAFLTRSLPGIKVRTSDALGKRTIKKRQILKEKSLPFKTAEVVFYTSIDKFDVTESGRNQIRQKSSRYISGQRWVHNPQHDHAYNDWQNAVRSYNSMKSQRNQALRTCNQMKNVYARSFCQGAVRGISSSSKDNARARYNSTPRQLAKDVISSYRYSIRNIKVRGRLVASVSFYDKRNKTKLPPERFEVQINKEGHIHEDVESRDQNGVKNGHFNVPDLLTEKDNAKKELINKIVAKLTKKVDHHYYNRYCLEGVKHLKNKRRAKAAESFGLCKQLARAVGAQQDFTVASNAINRYIGISPEDAFKYAKDPAKAVAQTKTPVEEGAVSRAPASADPVDAVPTLGTWPSTPSNLSKRSVKALNKFLARP